MSPRTPDGRVAAHVDLESPYGQRWRTGSCPDPASPTGSARRKCPEIGVPANTPNFVEKCPMAKRPAHDYARVDKHVPVTRRAATANPYSPVMMLISLIATLGILMYAQFLL